MSRRGSQRLLLCLACFLCLQCFFSSSTSGALSVAAQGSASRGAGTCSPSVWMTTSAPTIGFDFVYPNNSISYVRHNYTLPPETFFIQHWYVGIIIIVVVVGGAYILLGMWVCYHFEYCDQRKAKKVVAESYVTKGYFDIDRYVDHRERRDSSGQSEMDERSSHSRSRSFGRSGTYDYTSYDDSYSDDYGSASSSSSSSDDGMVYMNPLEGDR